MRQVQIAGLVLILGLCTPGGSSAGFQWLQDWQIAPISGPGSFGPITAEKATGSGSAVFTFDVPTTSQPNRDVGSQIMFSRTFLLLGSPAGWNVDLEGTVMGQVGGLHAEGTLSLLAMILNQGQAINLFTENGGGGQVFPVKLSTALDYSLLDGLYEVAGTFTAGTILAPSPFQGSINVASATGDFTTELTATPVPEAGSLSLLIIGATGVATALTLKRRRQSTVGKPATV